MNSKSRFVSIVVRAAILTCVWTTASSVAAAAAIARAPGAAQATGVQPPASPPSVAPPAAATAPASAAAPPADAAPLPAEEPAAAGSPSAEPATSDFKTLDQEVQGMKKEVIDLNKDLFVLQEELLFPANTQVAVYVSMDVGAFFALDSVTLKIDNKEVKNYLYTAREAEALLKGGVQEIYLGNLKVGKHELVAFFTGKGPVERAYKRGATLTFDKGVGAKYLELKITDRVSKHQPEFKIKDWD